jgi:hypothetical protein
MTFSVWVDIFYSPNFGCLDKNGLFQQPRLFTPVVEFTALTLVYHAGKTVFLMWSIPAQIASKPTARLRVGFLILRRTKK